MDTVSERVSRVMAAKMQVTPDRITESARMDELVETIMSLEDEFKVEIPDAAAEKFHTVGDVVAFLSTRERTSRESSATVPGPNLSR
jgi:acyl carrier protein